MLNSSQTFRKYFCAPISTELEDFAVFQFKYLRYTIFLVKRQKTLTLLLIGKYPFLLILASTVQYLDIKAKIIQTSK